MSLTMYSFQKQLPALKPIILHVKPLQAQCFLKFQDLEHQLRARHVSNHTCIKREGK